MISDAKTSGVISFLFSLFVLGKLSFGLFLLSRSGGERKANERCLFDALKLSFSSASFLHFIRFFLFGSIRSIDRNHALPLSWLSVLSANLREWLRSPGSSAVVSVRSEEGEEMSTARRTRPTHPVEHEAHRNQSQSFLSDLHGTRATAEAARERSKRHLQHLATTSATSRSAPCHRSDGIELDGPPRVLHLTAFL